MSSLLPEDLCARKESPQPLTSHSGGSAPAVWAPPGAGWTCSPLGPQTCCPEPAFQQSASLGPEHTDFEKRGLTDALCAK